jgi:uncharacterized protein (TIGR02996 family)
MTEREEFLKTFLDGYVAKEAENAFAKGFRSALVLCSQYWCDEADDAVHPSVLVSTRDAPRWPPVNGWREPLPEGEGGGGDAIPYIDNNEIAIQALGPYCQGGSQEVDERFNSLPIAIARVGEGLDFVAELERPWPYPLPELDEAPLAARARALLAKVYEHPADEGARHVLADALVEAGDPRGEAIALGFRDDPGSRQRVRELADEHGLAWLGRLTRAIPAERAVIAGGFVKRATMAATDESTAGFEEWATVETLRFAPESAVFCSETMRGLRDVEGLHAPALERMVEEVRRPWAIESMAVRINHPSEVAPIDRASFPSLRRLRLIVSEDFDLAIPPGLERLEITAEGTAHVARFVPALERAPIVRLSWPRNHGPRLATEEDGWRGLHHDRAAGFYLELHRDGRAVIGLDALDGYADRSALLGVARLVPKGFMVELRASRMFTPFAEDLAIVREAQPG